MAIYKTPGVYVEETSAFPNGVIAVETSVPAFIGYTEKALFNGQSLHNIPRRIDTFMEFERFFGKGATTTYGLSSVTNPTATPKNYDVKLGTTAYSLIADSHTRFHLYDALKFFYQNGGSSCYIVSVGTYGNGSVSPDFTTTPFLDGIKILEKETEPTMLVIPDAVLFEKDTDCFIVQQRMLDHCGTQKNRVAILDVYAGDYGLDDLNFNPIDSFRNGVTSNHLKYGAAYYPWLHTAVVPKEEVGYQNLNREGLELLQGLCTNYAESTLKEDEIKTLKPYMKSLTNPLPVPLEAKIINSTLALAIPIYKLVMDAILKKRNLLPPSAAMAGIYAMVDTSRGVWKAPANVSLSSVLSPAVLIDHDQQEDLNVTVSGKSVNAIRSFHGRGVLVWGARTLDGNSNDWRYINVRRTTIMIEQSIKNALKTFVFEPNDANTWTKIKAMLEHFMTNLWKSGALAGAKPSDSFFVNVGLGTTMTSVDILDGNLIVEIGMALMRPAEFIILRFQQQMQTA